MPRLSIASSPSDCASSRREGRLRFGLLRVGTVGGDEGNLANDVLVELVELVEPLSRDPELVDAGAAYALRWDCFA
jgi:hypothetical protein